MYDMNYNYVKRTLNRKGNKTKTNAISSRLYVYYENVFKKS